MYNFTCIIRANALSFAVDLVKQYTQQTESGNRQKRLRLKCNSKYAAKVIKDICFTKS